MKKNMLISISQEVANIIQQERSYEDSYKQTVKKKVTRQAGIIDPTLTEDQLEHYANNPNEMSQLLAKKVGMASISLKHAVADIQDKCRDLQRL